MSLATRPLVSLLFDGATLSEHDELSVGAGRLGQPVWTPASLLGNLELRLGLPPARVAEGVRVQRWSQRLEELHTPGSRFYTESYRVDPLGTATALLAMRDELVASGWNGEAVPGGGTRLETLCEAGKGADLPPGSPDRLLRVESELTRLGGRPFDEIRLAEPRDVWPWRWQRVFGLLMGAGVPVCTAGVTFNGDGDVQSDLGRAQSALRGDVESPSPGLRGDGSLVLLRGETAGELAHALASLLRSWNDESTAILRGGENRVLDDALVGQGLASTGVVSSSRWRPAGQVLPLALELAFEPRDPYRVLELLTLPLGPFEGLAGRELASALAESPGIGGRAWREAKERIAGQVAAGGADRLERIAEWLEGPAHERTAPRGALLEVADRVGRWARGRLAFERERGARPLRCEMLGAASAQVEAFREALANDPRADLDLVAVRLLVEQVAGAGVSFEMATERAGRVAPVDSPAGLRVARNAVVWWHCVSGTEWRPSVRPWRRAEIDALRAAGIHLPDPAARLGVEASAWRQVVLAARNRLVLAVPRWSAGTPLEPHPVWDEIVARVGAGEADVARITVDARAMLEGRGGPHRVHVDELGTLALPEARAAWALRGESLGPATRHSASSLETLVGCPLRWVFHHRAGLREGSLVSLPGGARLNGTLGHRLERFSVAWIGLV